MTSNILQRLPNEAIANLASVMNDGETVIPPLENADQSTLIIAACQRIFTSLKLDVKLPTNLTAKNRKKLLEKIVDLGQCQYRPVKLSGEWWTRDIGNLLAFDAKSGQARVLLARKSKGYLLIDPQTGQRQTVSAAQAAEVLAPSAIFFYPRLPEKPVTWGNLFRFALSSRKADLARIISTQSLMGLLGLWVPIATGALFETVIPNADFPMLIQFVIALALNTIAISSFNVAQIIALMRLKFKINVSTQAAIWDRLLRLPTAFFRRFSAGDLADRASGIDAIQSQLTGALLQTVIGGIFSIITLALMCYYDIWLSLAAVGLVLIVAIVNIIGAIIQYKYQKAYYRVNGKLFSFMLQLLTAINKLRVANREANSYEQWSVQYAEKSRLLMRAGQIIYRLGAFQAGFSVFTTMVLYILVIWRGDSLSFGDFIVFNAAFGQFFASVLSLASVIASSIAIIPVFQRIKPILKAEPESAETGIVPQQLTGTVSLKALNFRYDDDSPWVLKNVSMEIKAGQFVAIVGASGAGKSTLLRLLLGFEHIEQGSILYDEHNLSQLRIKNLRQQMGTVLQHNKLMPGSILTNIIGTHPLTEADAWAAAKAVAIDQDIADMPMQMQTLMTESGRSLSMGQRQRLLLAQAIVHQPKILLLDEATSAVDNVTQRHIYQHLATLPITKIVVAHRMSTIADADVIYVMDKGEIVQSGDYQTLLATPGIFQQLAERQVI